MKLLDLFCGAGGAAEGYHRVGFEVVGVDHKKQKNYPFEFIQMDAFKALERFGPYVDVIHASPPCQAWVDSWMNRRELSQAIPPAYTEYIGNAMRQTLFKAV